ncbi:MAG: Spermidine/spermine N(1)-acetyltransferase [Firmicutes bacterium]|nr:Spermidine/spermine N(1)-acetyltransferase [Bacillota bacterium]
MIRLAAMSDIPSIQMVARVAWEHTYREIMRPKTRSMFLDEFYNYEALSKALAVRPGGVWVVTEQEMVLGFIQVVPMLDGNGLEIARLYVMPNYQRQGLGKLLLTTAIESYPQTKWWALVERDDDKAVQFYRQQGFRKQRDLTLNLFGEELSFVEYNLSLEY